MFTKEQLIDRVKGYFDNKEIKEIHATSDGQCFYTHNKADAEAHAKSVKAEVIIITRADVEGASTKKEETPSNEDAAEEDFEALKVEWNELSGGKSINKKIKYATLLKKVEALRPSVEETPSNEDAAEDKPEEK